MVRLAEGRAQGQDDPALEDLRHPTRALTQLARDRIGLLKVGMASIQDQRLAAGKLVTEEPGETGIPPFGQAGCLRRSLPLDRIEVDVEVFGLEDFEVEIFETDLVAAEVLRVAAAAQPCPPRPRPSPHH